MATVGGPRIVRNGLVLNLDAGQRTSYSGSGDNWYDLSGNKRIGVLTNGPTFNNGNGGYITFDGIDDFTNTTFLPRQTDSGLSVFAWVYLTSLPSAGIASGIWGHYGVSSVHCHLEMYNTYSRLRLGNINTNSLPVFSTGSWKYAGFTSTGSNHIYYVDAKSQATWSGTTGAIFGNPNSTSHMIGRSDTGRTWNGYIAHTCIYNRALSASEVLQNFNTTKGRFGL